MRKKQHALDIDKAKKNLDLHRQKVKEYGPSTAEHPKECNFCSNTLLKDLKYPMEKVNKMFMAEYLHMKYNRPEELAIEEKD